MHPGGAGTPPAGGGSGAPRPGPARPGRGRGPPRLVSGARPVGMGTPPRPRSRSRPQDRMVPPGTALPEPRSPRFGGAPMEGGALGTAGYPRVRQPRTTRHRRALPRHTEVMSNRPPNVPLRFPQLPPRESPTQLRASCSPAGSNPPKNPWATSHPWSPQPGCPQPPTCAPCPAPIQAPPPTAPPSVRVPLWSHTGPVPAPTGPLGAPRVDMHVPLYACAHCMYLEDCEGHTGVILQVPVSMVHVGTVPRDASCPTVWPFPGGSLWTRRRAIPRGDLPWVSEERPTRVAPDPICVPSAHPCSRPTLAFSSCIFCCQDSDCTNWHRWP